MAQRHDKKNERDYERDRTDKIIATRFKSSLMSDAKWGRLLEALTDQEGLVQHCRVKLVWDDEIRFMGIDGCTRDFDFWPHSMEGMISGYPRGWYDYKEIEWIEFESGSLDLVRIESVIQNIGQFDLDKTDDGLRLYAYR